ncbi:MAG: hypothetical protein C5B50_15500 [Verrucomicrobia bacterium]|nr:MAG: hypothetical protein C5B50_15500 [Verrucomicrobiota bacterium]
MRDLEDNSSNLIATQTGHKFMRRPHFANWGEDPGEASKSRDAIETAQEGLAVFIRLSGAQSRDSALHSGREIAMEN